MIDWLAAIDQALRVSRGLVRVVVSRVQGSAPREVGATMLVMRDTDAIVGSIGGGHLEWKAIEIAHAMLRDPQCAASRLDRFVLGATLGQCCGGAVELWFDRFDAGDAGFIGDALRQREQDASAQMVSALHGEPRLRVMSGADAIRAGLCDAESAHLTHRVRTEIDPLLVQPLAPTMQALWLFGAGHVGRALVNILADLPFRVSWIDSRDAVFPAQLPANVSTRYEDDPADAVADAPQSAMFLVMTHSHDLDYAICRALLAREDLAWAGLIGSRSKARQFAHRFLRHGISVEQAARLTCPIGLPGIASKLPAAIALSVAAQVLDISERLARQPSCDTRSARTHP